MSGLLTISFLLSYFYLRLENWAWPPPGVSQPGLLTVTIATVLVVAGGAAMWRALRSISTGDQIGLKLGLAAAIGLAGSGAAVQLVHFSRLGFDSQTHAYGSIFHTLGGFAFAVILAGLIMAAMTLYWASRGYYSVRRNSRVANVAGFWAAMVAVWVVGFGILHLAPYLT